MRFFTTMIFMLVYIVMWSGLAEAGYTFYPYGQIKWKQEKVGKLTADMTLTDNGLLYMPVGNKIACYDIHTGNKLWEIKLDLTGKISEPLLVDNGAVYAAGIDGIQQMKPNGSVTWLYRIYPKAKGTKSSGVVATGPGGLIYLGVTDGLYALEPRKNYKWRYSNEQNVVAAMGDREAVYVCTGDKNEGYGLRALDSKGERVWHRGLGDIKNIQMTLGPDGHLYVITNPTKVERNTSGKIQCFDRSTGKERWTYSVKANDLTKVSFLENDTLFFCSQNKVFSINIKDGTLRWDLPLLNVVSGVAVDKDKQRLYAGSTDGRIYCVSFAGRLIWEKEMDKTTGQTLHKDGGIMIDTCKDEKDAISRAPVMLKDGGILVYTDKGFLVKFVDVK